MRVSTSLSTGVQFAATVIGSPIFSAIAIAWLGGAQVSGGTKAFESYMYSSAPTSFRTSRTGIGKPPPRGVMHDGWREKLRRAYVWGRFKEPKSKASKAPVPMHPLLAGFLLAWREKTAYARENDFVFPSIRLKGKKPLSLRSSFRSTFVPLR